MLKIGGNRRVAQWVISLMVLVPKSDRLVRFCVDCVDKSSRWLDLKKGTLTDTPMSCNVQFFTVLFGLVGALVAHEQNSPGHEKENPTLTRPQIYRRPKIKMGCNSSWGWLAIIPHIICSYLTIWMSQAHWLILLIRKHQTWPSGQSHASRLSLM